MSANPQESMGLESHEPRINADIFLAVVVAPEQEELPLDQPVPEDEPELPGIPPR